MRLTDGDAEAFFDILPKDVQAVLNLFGDDYKMWVGASFSYVDVERPDGVYMFIQSVVYRAEEVAQQRRRFISWVRSGMPQMDETDAWKEEADEDIPQQQG